MSDSKNIIITKETIQRLIKDVKQIIKNPLTDNGIYYKHDEDDMLKGYALIIGPSETPYFGGFYFFEFKYPADYPHSPPSVTYCTNGEKIRFNPNLYCNGKVCISLLNTWRGEQWTSCQTISTILLNLCTILNNDPLLNEPGVTNTHPDYSKYNKIIEFKNIDIAILKMVNKTNGIYLDKFEMFYPIVKEHFIKNKDLILDFIKKQKEKYPLPEVIVMKLYGMETVISYDYLLKQMNNAIENTVIENTVIENI